MNGVDTGSTDAAWKRLSAEERDELIRTARRGIYLAAAEQLRSAEEVEVEQDAIADTGFAVDIPSAVALRVNLLMWVVEDLTKTEELTLDGVCAFARFLRLVDGTVTADDVKLLERIDLIDPGDVEQALQELEQQADDPEFEAFAFPWQVNRARRAISDLRQIVRLHVPTATPAPKPRAREGRSRATRPLASRRRTGLAPPSSDRPRSSDDEPHPEPDLVGASGCPRRAAG